MTSICRPTLTNIESTSSPTLAGAMSPGIGRARPSRRPSPPRRVPDSPTYSPARWAMCSPPQQPGSTRAAPSASLPHRSSVPCLTATASPAAVVNSTGDDGDMTPGDGICDTGSLAVDASPECTLRAAIGEANASASVDTIEFAIPVADPGHAAGVWTIGPASAAAPDHQRRHDRRFDPAGIQLDAGGGGWTVPGPEPQTVSASTPLSRCGHWRS